MSQNLLIGETGPLPDNLSYDNEISQEENLNANSRLWIQRDGTLFKEYVTYDNVTSENIDNLFLISSSEKLRKIPEISMPLAIYEEQGRIAGYLMEYHDMKSFAYYLNTREHSVVLRAFQQIAMVINKLPRGVYIGDLHAGNVLVNENDIRIIDVDGFSLKQGHEMTCPLKNFSDYSVFFKKKYRNKNGDFFVSRDSDIACLLWLFLSYIMGTNPFNYTETELKRYIAFLADSGIPKGLSRMLTRMMSPRHNCLIPGAFSKINHELLDKCSYRNFVLGV